MDIDRDGKVLATASADQTVKLWGLGDGQRLDTLGQPEGEMLCVRFAPDGKSIIASGADKQLRVWEIVSKDKPAINPLRLSRYAHEEPVTQLFFRGDRELFSLSEDRSIKLWQLPDLKPLGVVATARDIPTGISKLKGDHRQIMIADYGGTISAVTPPAPSAPAERSTATTAATTRLSQLYQPSANPLTSRRTLRPKSNQTTIFSVRL